MNTRRSAPPPDIDVIRYAKPWQLILAAALAGGGLSVAMPIVAPNMYRQDPFTGSEGKELRAELRYLKTEVDDLRELVTEFMIAGPREVRNALARLEEKLDDVSQSHTRQEQHLKELLERVQRR